MFDDFFKRAFEALTGNEPLSWQRRLFVDHFATNEPLGVIDVPTGLGKTMVMAIWLIARMKRRDAVPTRLIYVVDRRTVVDQASDLAKKLRDNCRPALGCEPPAISTLRGQLADNREWSRDPSRPAIIIGTVDLIGSALLFSGHRSSFKRRPLKAGLLGCDSLLVLDEAHLSKPFEKLLGSIGGFNQLPENSGLPIKPLRVIRMSATSSNSTGSSPPFTLQFDKQGNLTAEDAKDETIVMRFGAKKRLTLTTLGEKEKLADKLANAAIELAENPKVIGKRIAVFVRKPEDVKAIADLMRNHTTETIDETGSKPRKTKRTPYADSVKVLTGTMRGLERDELVDKDVFKERWLNGDLKPDGPANQSPVFLISTSAGEVGFDLNADHLVGNEAPLDSWIQRLGRVNRRGMGDATVVLVRAGTPADKTDFDKACTNTSELFTDGMDVSAQALASLRLDHWKGIPFSELKLLPLAVGDDEFLKHCQKRGIAVLQNSACTPAPTTVDLTDILLDAWSMTSITQPMPGRPEVGPWLRGVDEWEPPQTTIAWRAELDEPGFASLNLDDIQEWFDTHRVLTHETLSVPTNFAAKHFLARWTSFTPSEQTTLGDRLVVVDRAGIKAMSLATFMKSLERDEKQPKKTYDNIRFAELILPASFGGIERGKGLLDAAAPEVPKDENTKSINEQQSARAARLVAPDVADIAPNRQRMREIIVTNEDGEPERRTIGGGTKPAKPAVLRLMLASDDDTTVRLVSYVPKREKPEYGSEKQTLQQHVSAVRRAVNSIFERMPLPDDIRRAAELAADYHDHGKNRERWQRTIGGTATEGTTDWVQQEQLEGNGKHQCLGKSGDEMKREPRGYRHEFGSLREFTDAFNAGKLLDESGKPIGRDVFDLAMHLIATHHGRGRPHFPKGGFDPDCESRSDDIHSESIRRFARLQRRFGWWTLAWLENLLRCADQLASDDEDSTQMDEQEGAEI